MSEEIGHLKILKTGLGTSVQDLGRFGFAEYGVPFSGALDTRSSSWVNHLLKNEQTDAVLEICQPGLKLHFDKPAQICLAGAKADIRLNGEEVSPYGILVINTNDQLEIGKFHRGSVLYLGIKNGFQSEKVMESRSWLSGLTSSGSAKKDDQIQYFASHKPPIFTASKAKWDFNRAQDQSIAAYPGPEWDLLSFENQTFIESMEFTISDVKNRMAIQLEELLPNSIPEMATSPVFPGTVQLTSGGKIIVLMKDAQVTGGYPRILQVDQKGLSILAQKKAKQTITFRLMDFSDFGTPSK